MTARQRSRLFASLGLALACGLLVVGALQARYLDTIQFQASDLLFKTRGAQTSPQITVVGIDERTLAALSEHGRLFTWPRTLHAQVIRELHQAGARVIVLDLLFDVPAPGDEELAEAIAVAGNVVSPIAGEGPTGAADPGQPVEFQRTLTPLPSLQESSTALGHANQFPDPDGAIRSIPLVVSVEGEQAPALPLAAAASYLRRPTALEGPARDGQLPFVGRMIPVDPQLRMRVNYLGPPTLSPRQDVIPMVSYLEVLEGDFRDDLVRDRIVFIGTTALALADDYWVPTSVGETMHGVEIHAHAAATILSGSFLSEMPRGAVAALVLAFAALVGLLLFALSPIPGALGSLFVALVYVLAGSVAFDTQGVIFNFVYPLTGMALAFASVTLYRVLFEQREQRALQAAFAQYVPPAVATEVAKNPESLKLGGERRMLTILFTDLKDFTSFSETIDPELLSGLISEYLDAMTRVVFERQGTVDKYIGDAVMAIWNAPQDQPDHARRACLAALAMQRELAALSDRWEQRGLPRQHMRIGINTGPASVGNMGSALRLAYTAIGDSVNLAARLEPLNNEYGTWICLSELTRAEIGSDLRTRYLDLVAVKGRAEPVAAYELVGLEAELSDERRMLLDRYEDGIALYRERRFSEAVEGFRGALAINAKDGPSALYLGRSLELAEDPPRPDWDGVYLMKHK